MIPLAMADVPLKYRDEDPATLAEAVALAPLVEQDAAAWLVRRLADGLESAGDLHELRAAWRRVERYGHSVPRGRLAEVARLRATVLDAEARAVRARMQVAA